MIEICIATIFFHNPYDFSGGQNTMAPSDFQLTLGLWEAIVVMS